MCLCVCEWVCVLFQTERVYQKSNTKTWQISDRNFAIIYTLKEYSMAELVGERKREREREGKRMTKNENKRRTESVRKLVG